LLPACNRTDMQARFMCLLNPVWVRAVKTRDQRCASRNALLKEPFLKLLLRISAHFAAWFRIMFGRKQFRFIVGAFWLCHRRKKPTPWNIRLGSVFCFFLFQAACLCYCRNDREWCRASERNAASRIWRTLLITTTVFTNIWPLGLAATFIRPTRLLESLGVH